MPETPRDQPAPTSLRAYPRPGRLSLRGVVPGAGSVGMAAAGRDALRRLRAEVLADRGAAGMRHRLLARLRGPQAADLGGLALHAAEVAGSGWQQAKAGPLVISVAVDNAGGETASLAWKLDGTTESLRWTLRGGSFAEDGACQGAAAVEAALGR